MKWLIESNMPSSTADRLAEEVRKQGSEVLRWDGESTPRLSPDERVFFYGSLQGCVRFQSRWNPGVIGTPENHRVSVWSQQFPEVIFNRECIVTSVGQVQDAEISWEKVFARPDSPLKPFSGRVLTKAQLSPMALDHGFYYEDESLPVCLSPYREIQGEWRFLVFKGEVVTGCAYDAGEHEGNNTQIPNGAEELAQTIASADWQPDPAYVVDICQSEGDFYLLEFNLFSGADWYQSDLEKAVAKVNSAF